MKQTISISLDKLGICTSTLCMLHCIAVPVVFIFGLDSLLLALENEWIELVIIGTSLVVGLISFFSGYRVHGQHSLPVLFMAGFLLIVNGEGVDNIWLAAVLSVSGALVIAYAHIQNLKFKTLANVQ